MAYGEPAPLCGVLGNGVGIVRLARDEFGVLGERGPWV